MSATSEALKRNFVKPLVSAAVGGFMLEQEGFGIFTVQSDVPGISSMNGQKLSSMKFGALLGFGSSFIVESLNNIFHSIDKANRTKHLASFVTHSAGSMASWALLPKLLGDIGPLEQKKLAKIGFLSEVFSQWVHENFVEDGSFGQDVLDML